MDIYLQACEDMGDYLEDVDYTIEDLLDSIEEEE